MADHAWLFWPVIILYALAAGFYFVEVYLQREGMAKRGRTLAITGAALQGVALLGHAMTGIVFQSPNLFETASAVVWLIVLTFLILEHRLRITAAGVFVSPLAAVIALTTFAFRPGPSGRHLVDPRWLVAHVGVIVLGYAALALAVCFALLYLTGERLLKAKSVGGLFRYFPSLDIADRMVLALTAFGLSMLTAGIVSGVLWSLGQGRSPWLERRLVLSALAWLLFAAYLFARSIMGWQGSRAKWVIVFGFGVLVVTMVGYRAVS